MLLVVGLGNPGERYVATPHNVGFRVLDRLACDLGEVHWRPQFEGQTISSTIAGERVVLLQPLTFMNASGSSVQKALAFYNLDISQAVIVHDELDLPAGTVKLKMGGGEAGHNGLRSVSQCMGTRDYLRLRVGVGRPIVGTPKSFLLSAPSASVVAEIGDAEVAAVAAVEKLTAVGVARAMAVVNRSVAQGAVSTGTVSRKTVSEEAVLTTGTAKK